MSDDGAVSTLDRATDLTEEELARVEETFITQGIGGWSAVQSHLVHRGPPPPIYACVRRVGREGLSFEEAVAAAAARHQP